MAPMSTTQRNAFLKEPRIATFVTLYRDGSPAAVPVWFEWDGERARLFTLRTSPKVARLRADPRVCLSVAEPAGMPEVWVTIEGTATVVDGGFALAQRLAPRYYPTDRAQQALAEWGKDPNQWVTVEITPTRIRPMAP